jgi:hypothetical protein
MDFSGLEDASYFPKGPEAEAKGHVVWELHSKGRSCEGAFSLYQMRCLFVLRNDKYQSFNPGKPDEETEPRG